MAIDREKAAMSFILMKEGKMKLIVDSRSRPIPSRSVSHEGNDTLCVSAPLHFLAALQHPLLGRCPFNCDQ